SGARDGGQGEARGGAWAARTRRGWRGKGQSWVDCPLPAPGTRRSEFAAPKPSALVLSGAKRLSASRSEKGRGVPPSFTEPVAAMRSGRGLLVLGCFRRLRAVDQLDQRHRRLVADAEAELEDAQVPARTRLVARAELVEELHDDVTIAQPVECEAAIRDR